MSLVEAQGDLVLFIHGAETVGWTDHYTVAKTRLYSCGYNLFTIAAWVIRKPLRALRLRLYLLYKFHVFQ